jgi:hypothetical protein
MEEAKRGKEFRADATGRLQALGFPCKVATSSGQLGMFASRSIRGGEIICSESALTLTVAQEAQPHVCAVCLNGVGVVEFSPVKQ